MNLIEFNISRLQYLLRLYSLTEDDLLLRISEGLKNPILRSDVFAGKIRLSYLKKIDNIFKKGLHFYLDPMSPDESKEASIFFRKDNFNSELNIGARKIVNLFKEQKISLSALSKLSEFTIERILPAFTIADKPEKAAHIAREALYPSFNANLKDFLKALINKLSDSNIFVLEFVETWNKIDKANIDGFYLSPNFIGTKKTTEIFSTRNIYACSRARPLPS